MIAIHKISLDQFLFELHEQSFSLRVAHRCHAVFLAIADLILCVPHLVQRVYKLIQLQRQVWDGPPYMILNREGMQNFQAFPSNMPESCRAQLVQNLHAILDTYEHLKLERKVYYCTEHRHDLPSAEAFATGQVVIYDEICTSTPGAAQSIFVHECAHIDARDGYMSCFLETAADVARIYALMIFPLSLLLVSPLLSYGTTHYSQYCEHRADRKAVERVQKHSAFAQEWLMRAEELTEQVLQSIETRSPHAYCTLANYAQFNRAEKRAVIFKVADLGIRSIAVPSFNHPTHVERYQRIRALV